jgi:hypothetical protein
MGCGEERIALRVGRRDCWDCWTRVLRRSAGWRRMDDVRPEQSPAEKWKMVLDDVEVPVFAGTAIVPLLDMALDSHGTKQK